MFNKHTSRLLHVYGELYEMGYNLDTDISSQKALQMNGNHKISLLAQGCNHAHAVALNQHYL